MFFGIVAVGVPYFYFAGRFKGGHAEGSNRVRKFFKGIAFLLALMIILVFVGVMFPSVRTS
ncbi:MAG: hypothetical protein IPF60_07435 [Betaproteobacteria bacterium]|nr:hypothetical protein [Betaproteobacteria bacterium]